MRAEPVEARIVPLRRAQGTYPLSGSPVSVITGSLAPGGGRQQTAGSASKIVQVNPASLSSSCQP
jgi:hypothetical protein